MNNYIPKVGDLVITPGQNGAFRVLSISESGAVELRLFNLSKRILVGQPITVPRTVLQPFKEDASQAAVRVVREATEKD